MGSEAWQELACGGCGEAKHRLRGLPSNGGGEGFRDVALVCVGCGSVTHLLVPKPLIRATWGRTAEGEKDDGIICPMGWKRDSDGNPI